ncbi:hypothetical protein ACFWPX_29835 [Nocardia sp. NPDC058518]|uniref:hypothetical protein n=1 Tax=Nocardia sp. NPDC058518 TaxID=3346534 RepID=UPI003652CF78
MTESPTPAQPTIIYIDEPGNIVPWPMPSLFSERHSDDTPANPNPTAANQFPVFLAPADLRRDGTADA